MAYIGEIYLKVKLNGLGWDHDPEAKLAYKRLKNKIADFIQEDEHFVSINTNKTVSIIICRELDQSGVHSIEGEGVTVQQYKKIPLVGRYSE